MKKPVDHYFHTIKRKRTIKEIDADFDEYLKQFEPKIIRTYIENGKEVNVYESR